MKKIFRYLTGVFAVLSVMIIACVANLSVKLPNDFNTTLNSGNIIGNNISANIKKNSNIEPSDFASTNAIRDKYNARIMFMNSIPVKDVNIHMTEEMFITPCGTPFGIKLFTEGVVIVGISDVKTSDGVYNPARLAGLKKGDVIVDINGLNVESNEDVANIVESSKGEEINLVIKREEGEFEAKLKPIKSSDDDVYKAGIWVRDSSAGIGTMTFTNPKTNSFAGLGHGICDIDTGELLPLAHGDIICAKINGIKIGQKGNPGELKGSFYNNDSVIGTLDQNTITGVYGHLKSQICKQEEIIVAMKQQVKVGDANILTTISGESPSSYSIKIKSVNYNESSPTKNMVIEITDPNLLNQTGGIVQGMSGSPIIQNKKLIGAITHVFINDPRKGYAIFAENMLNTSTHVDYSAN